MIRPIRTEERESFNQIVDHPLQTWEWGEFKHQNGQKVERVGFFTDGKLTKALQVTFHTIPLFGGTAGYLPKSFMPDEEQLEVLKQLGEKHAAVFIKLEPNIAHPAGTSTAFDQIITFMQNNGAVAGRPLFARHTFVIDLTQTERELFENLSQKTRYNVRLAIKKGVTIEEDTSEAGMKQYVSILKETTQRQGFYAHTPDYFTHMWQTLGKGKMMKIFHATYQNKVLASWILFVLNGVAYYPYGASSNAHREVMASNLMMWELIRYAKSAGCTQFDLWGALGPKANAGHPWFGFHRFKAGYGGTLMEYLGSFDLVLQPSQYRLFRIAETVRWKVLRLKARLGL